VSLVQGAGGNTSLKCDGTLWVKASGTWLAEASERPIFLALDLAGVRRRLQAGESDPASPEVRGGPPGLRPSVETTLHALMPQRVVIHVHSVNTIAHAVRADGKEILGQRLAGLRWAWICYARPGLPLTQAIIRAGDLPDILVLANHGLVVAAETIEDAMALLAEVERRVSVRPRVTPLPDRAALQRLAQGSRYRIIEDHAVRAIATDPANLELATGGALYPDHVVFLGRSPLAVIEPEAAGRWIAAHQDSNALEARLLLIRGVGVLIREDAGAGAEAMARCLALVLPRIAPDAPIIYLGAAQEMELLGWDAEKHRQALDSARRG
jgi:rhamnose utilization protein RhaD (predicted bifunctional aldolase and dehydrogenase)